MSAPKLVEPFGCGRCGIPLPHGRQTGPGGLHGWERPTDAQIKERMKARRLARVVAREGALPVPAGSALQPPSELDRMRLRVDEVERAYTFDTAALKRRIDGLEQERHETNESLSLAAETLRENRDRIAELEALTPARHQTCRVCGAGYVYGEPCSSCAFKARMAAETQARVRHPYQLGHDLPGLGGQR